MEQLPNMRIFKKMQILCLMKMILDFMLIGTFFQPVMTWMRVIV